MGTRLLLSLLGAGVIFAAGETTASEAWKFGGEIITSLGPTGFVVWFAWYMVTTTIPTILKEHRESVAQLGADHKAAVAELAAAVKEMVSICRSKA